MSLEVKGTSSSSANADAGKSSAEIAKGKNSVASGFAGFFGSVIAVAKSSTKFSLVPDLKNKTQAHRTIENFYEEDRTVQQDDRNRQTNLHEVRTEKSKAENDTSQTDNANTSREMYTDRNSSYEDDSRRQNPQNVAGVQDSNAKDRTQNDNVQEGQNATNSGDPRSNTGVSGDENRQQAQGNASSRVTETEGNRSAEVGGSEPHSFSSRAGVAESSQTEIVASDATGGGISAKDLLQFLIAFQGVLRSALQSMNASEIDSSVMADELANLIGEDLTKEKSSALLGAVQALLVMSGGNATGQKEVTSSLQQQAGLQFLVRTLDFALQSPGQKLAKDLIQVLQLQMKTGSDVQTTNGSITLDASLLDGEIDPSLLERLQGVVARLQTGTNYGVAYTKTKATSENTQKLNFHDSEVLDALQGAKQFRNLKEILETPDDLRLRASRAFVEGDARKADNVIAKTTGNLLTQFASSSVVANEIRGQNREAISRFTVSNQNFGELARNVQAQNGEGKGAEQLRSLSEGLLLSKTLDGRGQADRFGESGMTRQSGSSFGLSGRLDSFVERANNAVKSDVPQNRQVLSQNLQEQVRVHIQRAVRAGEDRIRLQLRPAQLGRVDVQIQVMKDSTYVLRIFVEKQESLDLLRNDARSLLDSLRESGIKTGGENLEFSLQEGTREQDVEAKKKKGRGENREVQELDNGSVHNVQPLTLDNSLGESAEDSTSDGAEERLDVVV